MGGHSQEVQELVGVDDLMMYDILIFRKDRRSKGPFLPEFTVLQLPFPPPFCANEFGRISFTGGRRCQGVC